MAGALLILAVLAAADEAGWGDEPASLAGYQRITEADLATKADLRGRRVYLDGKFGGATRERVLLRASKVTLVSVRRPFDPARFASFRRDANVRVFGTVSRSGKQPAINVQRLEWQRDDSQRYGQARARIDRDDAAGLYALAERIRARFNRYGGERLLAWARETAREAVEVELVAHRNEPDALYDLAKRARRLVGDARLHARITEAALIAERRALPEDDPGPSFRLADKWDRLLPGRPEPTTLRRTALRMAESRLPAGDPGACFALARQYERLVGDARTARELTRRGLALEEGALGSRDYGARYRLSRKVAELVQDTPWSRSLLAAGAAIERRQLAGRPPAAHFRLAERYASELGDAVARDVLIRQGLTVQQRRLDPRDLNGHLELALAYLTRLGDRAACIERLRSCLALVPGEPRVRAKLTELGLVEVDGRWYEAARVQSDPKLTWEANTEKAIAAGRIVLGMAPRHVRRAWGEPARYDSVFTGNARSVQWTYSGVRPTRVVFHNGRVVAWSR